MDSLNDLLDDPVVEGFTLKLSDVIKQGVIQLCPTGSKYICNPPVLNTDEDYYGYTSNKASTIEALLNDGWELCTDNDYDDDAFTALRKGAYNLILLFTVNEWMQHYKTTELAKRFNLVNKHDRIDLFELVRNGSY